MLQEGRPPDPDATPVAEVRPIDLQARRSMGSLAPPPARVGSAKPDLAKPDLAKPDLTELRDRIRRLETPRLAQGAVLSLGLPLIEAALPGGGLPLGCLHEIIDDPLERPDPGAVAGFCACLLRPLAHRGYILWCLARADLYGPGLANLGFPVDRLILVRGRSDREILWAMEEGLRSTALAAVVGEPARLDLTASRRLQLAAEVSGVTGFVLRRRADPTGRGVDTSAAVTRWQIASAPSLDDGSGIWRRMERAMGRPRWRVELLRCRGSEAGGRWFLEIGSTQEMDDATSPVPLAAELADRPDRPIPRRRLFS